MNHNKDYCTISFTNNKDLDKALERIMYKSGQGFSMIDEKTISISKIQCDMLEKTNIKYTNLEYL